MTADARPHGRSCSELLEGALQDVATFLELGRRGGQRRQDLEHGVVPAALLDEEAKLEAALLNPPCALEPAVHGEVDPMGHADATDLRPERPHPVDAPREEEA